MQTIISVKRILRRRSGVARAERKALSTQEPPRRHRLIPTGDRFCRLVTGRNTSLTPSTAGKPERLGGHSTRSVSTTLTVRRGALAAPGHSKSDVDRSAQPARRCRGLDQRDEMYGCALTDQRPPSWPSPWWPGSSRPPPPPPPPAATRHASPSWRPPTCMATD